MATSMKRGEVHSGFLLEKTTVIKELQGELCEFRHARTGARLAWLNRREENMTFIAAFKTPPANDTGVFHILEHTVLCGSKKYPLRDPFLELMKGSMQTFLNAFTAPDNTMFAFSSKNRQDYLNLMKVYTDAVFQPAIYAGPESFYQEGWHYETEPGGALCLNGVVYNEMKGAYSSVDTLIYREITRALFPESCYRFESGGFPAAIPELPYEEFLKTHRAYYHMDNACFFVDGDAPINEVLAHIDGGYGDLRGELPKSLCIARQEERIQDTVVCGYDVGCEGETEGQAYITFGKLIGDIGDRTKTAACEILLEYLFGPFDAPLKLALLDAGLARDVSFLTQGETQQTFAAVTVRNTDADKLDEVKRCLTAAAEKLLAAGLDREAIAAGINRAQYQLRERDLDSMPEGICVGMSVLNAWLHGGAAADALADDALFCALRAALAQGRFEALLKSLLLEKDRIATVVHIPSPTKGAEDKKAETERLAAIASAWTKADFQSLEKRNARLRIWQETPDGPDVVAGLPALTKADIEAAPPQCDVRRTVHGDAVILQHSLEKPGIVYINMYFPLRCETQDYACAALMSRLIGTMPTAKYDAAALQTRLKEVVGSFECEIKALPPAVGKDGASAYFHVHAGATCENAEDAFELIREMLLNTDFSDGERLHDMLLQLEGDMQQDIIANGHRFALGKTAAMCSESGAIAEECGGINCYRWMQALNAHFDERAAGLQHALAARQSETFTKSGLTLGVSANADMDAVKKLADAFPAREPGPAAVRAVVERGRNIRFSIPADVSYAAACASLDLPGEGFSGKLRVLAKLISLEYLWNEVRVKGGAYGAGMNVAESGNVLFYSFRDPDPERTAETFANCGGFIAGLSEDPAAVEKYIIGTVSDMEAELRPDRRMLAAESDQLRGITRGDRLAQREEVLATTARDIRDCADLMRRIARESHTCIIGQSTSEAYEDGGRL